MLSGALTVCLIWLLPALASFQPGQLSVLTFSSPLILAYRGAGDAEDVRFWCEQMCYFLFMFMFMFIFS